MNGKEIGKIYEQIGISIYQRYEEGEELDKDLTKECKKIDKFPDIGKWNLSKAENINSMFRGCTKLSQLPSYENWDVRNVKDASYMFSKCPNIQGNINSIFHFKDGVNKYNFHTN